MEAANCYATRSDLDSLRGDVREDLAASEGRLDAHLERIEADLKTALNHQAHTLAEHEDALAALDKRQALLETRLWLIALAALLGGALPGGIGWLLNRLGP